MGVTMQRGARAVRSVLRGLLIATATSSLAGACSDSTGRMPAPAHVTYGCLLDTDCVAPQVCAFERCHERCESSRDCEGDLRCVLADEEGHVCQLEFETDCIDDTDCAGDQSCGVDDECRDQCADADDCVEGQACSLGSCADEEELTEDGELPVATGHEPDGGGGSADEERR